MAQDRNQTMAGYAMAPAILGAAQNVPVPASVIAAVATQLDARLSLLHTRLNELDARLDPILAPNAPPAAQQSGGTAPMPGSPHAMYLANLSAGLSAAIDRVERVLGRLEL